MPCFRNACLSLPRMFPSEACPDFLSIAHRLPEWTAFFLGFLGGDKAGLQRQPDHAPNPSPMLTRFGIWAYALQGLGFPIFKVNLRTHFER